MPGWLTLVSAGLRLLGLADVAERAIERWQSRREGRAEQHAADIEAEDATLRAELAADVEALSTPAETAAALKKGEF